MSWSVPIHKWLLQVGMISMFPVGSFVRVCSLLLLWHRMPVYPLGRTSSFRCSQTLFFSFQSTEADAYGYSSFSGHASGLTVTFVQPPAQNSSVSGPVSGLTMTKAQPPAQEEQNKAHAYFQLPTLFGELGSKLCFFSHMDSWSPTLCKILNLD